MFSEYVFGLLRTMVCSCKGTAGVFAYVSPLSQADLTDAPVPLVPVLLDVDLERAAVFPVGVGVSLTINLLHLLYVLIVLYNELVNINEYESE